MVCNRVSHCRSGVAIAMLVAVQLSGCAQTSRISDEVTTKRLEKAAKAVAVVRIGAASPACEHVAVLIGVRDGAGYRPSTWLKVYNVRSLTEPAVAEAVLEPGEYHVISYQCATVRGVKGVDAQAGMKSYAESYARFTLGAGEVVNVGYLHVHARRVGQNAFGRPVAVTVTVTDWPVAELDRYKARRPQVYAQMRTRLMTVGTPPEQAPASVDCVRLARLKQEGKLQTLPRPCTG